MLEDLDARRQVGHGLCVGRTQGRPLAGALVAAHRVGPLFGAGVVAAQLLGLVPNALGEALPERVGDPRVELLAAAAQERLIGRLLDQRVLEGVGRLRRSAAAQEHPRAHQPIEAVAQRRLVQVRDR